jgi:hypothetical protein
VVALFPSELFLWSPLHFRGVTFLSEVSLQSPLRFRNASFCEANLVSYFDPILISFQEIDAFITASGYIGSASLKTSHPRGLPL